MPVAGSSLVARSIAKSRSPKRVACFLLCKPAARTRCLHRPRRRLRKSPMVMGERLAPSHTPVVLFLRFQPRPAALSPRLSEGVRKIGFTGALRQKWVVFHRGHTILCIIAKGARDRGGGGLRRSSNLPPLPAPRVSTSAAAGGAPGGTHTSRRRRQAGERTRSPTASIKDSRRTIYQRTDL